MLHLGRLRTWRGPLLLVGGLVLLMGLTPFLGPESLPWNAVLTILWHQITGGLFGGSTCPPETPSGRCNVLVDIVWGARVPAVLLAATVGASLGISGASLQGVFRNSLADPYLLGLSSGAALGAALLLDCSITGDLGNHCLLSIPGADTPVLLPVAAFLGGLVPGTAVLLASLSRRTTPEVLLLTGVALNALFSATLATVLVFYQSSSIQVELWLLGGLANATWTNDALVLSVLLVAGTILALHGRAINLLQLGEDVARSLGTDGRRVTQRVILLSTVVTAVAVAFSGVIGFVGLVAPHVVRRLVGVDYRKVLPFSLAAGAAFLLVAWDIAQTAIPTVVLPVGIPTAFVGSIFFLYLLQRRAVASRERGGP